MDKSVLGNTGIKVSRMCFGTLTMGPLQANLTIGEGAGIIARAIALGVNFFDTAQLYETYAYIKEGMRLSGMRDIVVSTKTYAWNRQLAVEAVEQARKELDRDYIDIFMLHEQESAHTLRGHAEALETLYEYRQKGIIRAVGASMHHVAAVYGAVEKGLNVIHPLINAAGLGIADGTREDMEEAVKKARGEGLGVFTMKPLGGGNLFKKAAECLKYALKFPYADSVAIGVQSIAELEADVEFFETNAFTPETEAALKAKTRRLHIDSWCEGCGKCVERCAQRALAVNDGTAVCNYSKCVLCGYCSSVCPMWAIKVV